MATLALARQHYQAGDFARAEACCRQALLAEPSDPALFLLLGTACHRQRKVAEAVDCYHQVLRLHPDYADACHYLGIALQDQGKLDEAVEWLRRALALRPDLAEAHNNLGNALGRQGQWQEAVSHYRQAVSLLPSLLGAHFNLGNALARLGDPVGAAECFRRCLELQPRFAEAHFGLGNALGRLGKVDEAGDCYSQAAHLRPGWAEPLYNLGNVHRARGRVAEGVGCYREALRIRPGYVEAHNNLAEAYLELGQEAEARAHFQEALRRDPDAVPVLCNLATHGLFPDPPQAANRLRARLADARLEPLEASRLHFALAHLLDAVGAHDEAFAHFGQANALKQDLFRRAGQAYDPEEHHRFIDRLRSFFTPEYFRRVQGIGSDSEVPVFIVGMPRSGTTLVEQMLSGHPRAFGAGELDDMTRLAAELPARLGAGEPYPECLVRLERDGARSLAEGYLRRLTAPAVTAARVSDKLPDNYLHLGLVAALFPRARVLHCRRDPLDTCLSCYFQNFTGLAYTCDLAGLGRRYRDYELLTAHWREVLPLRMQEVQYEELVADPEGVGKRLVAFCGLDWDERCLATVSNPRAVRTASKVQVRQPVHTRSVGRWRHYTANLGPLRESLQGRE